MIYYSLLKLVFIAPALYKIIIYIVEIQVKPQNWGVLFIYFIKSYVIYISAVVFHDANYYIVLILYLIFKA